MAPDVVSSPCPTDDMLAALMQRALEPADARMVAAHLDECATCRQLAVAAVRSGLTQHMIEAPGPSELSLRETVDAREIATEVRATLGARFGRYELRTLLGTGGMGAVFDAYDAELDRAVALKVLRSGIGSPSGLADRLVHESRLMARVVHPSVITVYDAGREGDAVFIAMELIRGTTLTAWLASRTLDWRAIVEMFETAGHGLAAAHGAGIVHRDFKPDNVLVAHDGSKVVVTDFGIAREVTRASPLDGMFANGSLLPTLEGELQLTTDGAVVGTPAYMAPEQLAGQRVDLRADVFAFSVALWEALFGERPYRGRTVGEIVAAMQQPAFVPSTGRRIPARLARALEMGVSIDPRARWADMRTLLAELAAVRSARRHAWAGVAAAGLVGVGITAALLARAREPDRCAQGLAALDAAYNAQLDAAIGTALAGDPGTLTAVRAKLAATADAWRTAQRATCDGDRAVVQDAKTTACLEARRLELAASVDDLIANGAEGARLARTVADVPGAPALCASPAPGLLFARVPADRAQRRQVTALRGQLADADDGHARAAFTRAIADAEHVVQSAAAVWPPLHAEALLTLGRVMYEGGDINHAISTLRDAASIGERVHHDEVAANAWTSLALAIANGEGDPARALEYLTYAEAAAARIGRPASVMAWFHYTKGTTLVAAQRTDEAEPELQRAVALAETTSESDLANAIQGLGYLYDEQGRYADAVAAYRKAIEHLPRSPSGQIMRQPVYFERLAINLALLGKLDEALVEARRAVEIADRTLPVDQIDRPIAHVNLAHVLTAAGQHEAALTELTGAIAVIAKVQGTRSERYGEILTMQGDTLIAMHRYAEAEPLVARACEIIAFTRGEDTATYAQCEVSLAEVLIGLQRHREALPRLDRVVATLGRTYGEASAGVGDALSSRGVVHGALGHHREAVADLERAVALFAAQQIEAGYLASAKWRLGKQLWTTDRARARAEITAAIALFSSANPTWSTRRAEAEAWLERHDRATDRAPGRARGRGPGATGR